MGYPCKLLIEMVKQWPIKHHHAFIILTLVYVHNSHAQNNKNSWLSVNVGGPVDNVLADETVFAAVDGDLYQYSPDLKLISRTTSRTKLTNKALAKVPFKFQDLILTCLQNENLIMACVFCRTSDLLCANITWSTADGNFLPKTDLNENMHVLFDAQTKENLLISMSRPTARDYQLSNVINSTLIPQNSKDIYLPALGRFKMKQLSNSIQLRMTSVLPYGAPLHDARFLYDYLYTFQYQEYTHFLLNDIISSSKSDLLSARLARICNNDTDLYSYTEISLTCRDETNLYAKSAYLNTSIRLDDAILYVIFEAITDGHKNKPSNKSFLCAYSMAVIQNIFEKATKECHKGLAYASILRKLQPESSKPRVCQSNPSSDWCTSRINPYIDGSDSRYYLLKEIYHIDLDGFNGINFLYHVPRNLKPEFYIIGTDSGLITKFDQDKGLHYTIDLIDHRIKQYRHENDKFSGLSSNENISLRRGTRYSLVLSNNSSSGDIYAGTLAGEVHRIPIDQCEFYTSCKSCIRLDGLCGWCMNKCSKETECESSQWHDKSCPPSIERFEPVNGPLTGFTKLTIYGDNFGNSTNSIKVRIANQDCLVDMVSEEKLECRVQPVSESINSTVEIEVQHYGDIDSIGKTTSTGSYAYLEPIVFGLHSDRGQNPGEILVFGKNLNIGSRRTVFIGPQSCSLLNVQYDRILCSLGQDNQLDKHHPESPSLLRVTIDDHPINITKLDSYGNYSLTTHFEYSTWEIESNGYLSSIVVVLVIVAIVSPIFVYITRCDDYICLKFKQARARRLSARGDDKVSFRNPDSFKFGNKITRPGESLNGLITLHDGKVGTDYFSRQDQFEQDRPLMHQSFDEEIIFRLAEEKILIDRNRLTLGQELGSGQFGCVRKGYLKVDDTSEHMEVALKTLQGNFHLYDMKAKRNVIHEALIMNDFKHENVLSLIGVAFDSNGSPIVITPLMRYGDLKHYISDETFEPTLGDLMQFGVQVAKGMAYLSNLKYVHRDLAARNCLLDENLIVKVADFGLSRDIYESEYYASDDAKAKLPVKWMAIESLEAAIYTTKSDVWSYGILLWELMTRGVLPYPDIDNFELRAHLKAGNRMLRPRYCPKVLYEIMRSCWNESPAHRPTFDELVESITHAIGTLQEVSMKNAHYERRVLKEDAYVDAVE